MDYIFCARTARNGAYENEPGATSCLAVPTSATAPKPEHALHSAVWKAMVLDLAQNGCPWGAASGDVVILTHGYNTSPGEMLMRHRLMRAGLERNGFDGVVVSFDWASDDRAVSYMQDRTKARHAAERFARDVLPMIAGRAGPGHRVRTHVIGHSMGCLVLRDAFALADKAGGIVGDWSVDQVVLVAADVAADTLAPGAEASAGLQARCKRLSNYYSQHDEILSMSDAARASAGPRAGRIGLRGQHAPTTVDVYCGDHFEARRDSFDANPSASHTWYFEDADILRDIALTVDGQDAGQGVPVRSVAETTKGLALAG